MFLLLALGLFVAALALAIDGANLWSARQELQIAADAAALAALQSLADDRMLTDLPDTMRTLTNEGRDAAVHVGRNNPAAGLPHEFQPNWRNLPSGDLVFGFIGDPATRGLSPAAETDLDSPLLNAVFVRAERTKERGSAVALFLGRISGSQGVDVRAEALAYLDRDIVGFRPQGRTPLPLAPLALFSDPSRKHPASWELQVESPPTGSSQDRFYFDRAARRFRAVGVDTRAGDFIREMTVRLPLAGADFDEAESEDEPNGVLLTLGKSELRPRQLDHGVFREDIAEFGGQLVLAWDDKLPVPGDLFAPNATDPAQQKLLSALERLAQSAEPRVWPVYRTVQAAGDGEPTTIIVSGFVAARLISARTKTEPYPHLELMLQPCELMTNAALTERRPNEALLGNRYVSKPRLLR